MYLYFSLDSHITSTQKQQYFPPPQTPLSPRGFTVLSTLHFASRLQGAEFSYPRAAPSVYKQHGMMSPPQPFFFFFLSSDPQENIPSQQIPFYDISHIL